MLSTEAQELILCAENDSTFYPSVVKTLGRFHKQGTYSKDRSIPYIHRYLILPVAREQVGSRSIHAVNAAFPHSDRIKAAEEIADGLVAEFRLGNYC